MVLYPTEYWDDDEDIAESIEEPLAVETPCIEISKLESLSLKEIQ